VRVSPWPLPSLPLGTKGRAAFLLPQSSDKSAPPCRAPSPAHIVRQPRLLQLSLDRWFTGPLHSSVWPETKWLKCHSGTLAQPRVFDPDPRRQACYCRGQQRVLLRLDEHWIERPVQLGVRELAAERARLAWRDPPHPRSQRIVAAKLATVGNGPGKSLLHGVARRLIAAGDRCQRISVAQVRLPVGASISVSSAPMTYRA
jgi:hypothetical protein